MDYTDQEILDLENKLADPKLSKQWKRIYKQQLENLLYKQNYDISLENSIRREYNEQS